MINYNSNIREDLSDRPQKISVEISKPCDDIFEYSFDKNENQINSSRHRNHNKDDYEDDQKDSTPYF